jgi:predicted phosphodiesterase
VRGPLTRILSDIHFGDHASGVHAFAQLRPLTEGVDALVLNGDTLDTRPSPWPEHTAQCRADALAFAAAQPTTILTGNHDPDFSTQHAVELAGGQVVATHGDIVFDQIVPWGTDGPIIGPKIAAGLAALPPEQRNQLAPRFAVWRRVAAEMPQRHQSEPNRLKYALKYAADTIWPPTRILRVLHAWRVYPKLVAEFARVHWPRAKFVVVGHTHRPGVWSRPGAATVINTGSYCPPLGSYAVDVEPARIAVRKVELIGKEYRPGPVVAEFPLAAT